MDDSQIAELWTTLKEYLDKKHVEMAAERYVDVLADFGISDETFKDVIGAEENLDHAISYYLDIDEDVLEEETDWDE
jgi:hypothetical protein|tara:strand:- start:290 stop:520 length:231 start_codon:yes stop_codon:yes gene_type:complete